MNRYPYDCQRPRIINLNRCTVTQLDTLPDLTSYLARKLYKARLENRKLNYTQVVALGVLPFVLDNWIKDKLIHPLKRTPADIRIMADAATQALPGGTQTLAANEIASDHEISSLAQDPSPDGAGLPAALPAGIPSQTPVLDMGNLGNPNRPQSDPVPSSEMSQLFAMMTNMSMQMQDISHRLNTVESRDPVRIPLADRMPYPANNIYDPSVRAGPSTRSKISPIDPVSMVPPLLTSTPVVAQVQYSTPGAVSQRADMPTPMHGFSAVQFNNPSPVLNNPSPVSNPGQPVIGTSPTPAPVSIGSSPPAPLLSKDGRPVRSSSSRRGGDRRDKDKDRRDTTRDNRDRDSRRDRREKSDSSESDGSRSSDRSDEFSAGESTDPDQDNRRQWGDRKSNPKLPRFDGSEDDWEVFSFQFRELAHTGRWSKRVRLEKLISCLKGTAVKFVKRRPSKIRRNYKKLMEALEKRYCTTDQPCTLRKQLASVCQLVDESLETWADRIYALTLDAYPQIGPNLAESLAVENFLKGCREKRIALTVSSADNPPRTIPKAVRKMRELGECHKLFLGSISSPVKARKVSFESTSSPKSNDSDTVRRIEGLLEKQFGLLLTALQKPAQTAGSKAPDTPSAPPASKVSGCFVCLSPDHFARECPSRPRGRARSASPSIICYHCRKPGHISMNCPEKSGDSSKQSSGNTSGSEP